AAASNTSKTCLYIEAVRPGNKPITHGKSGDHNVHLPVPEQVEVAMFKEKVKERVVKETTAIGKIYDKEMASLNLSDGALGLIPLADEAKASLNRLRRQTTPPL
ncbi:unnamed protein product, partial [Rotaria socialis]